MTPDELLLESQCNDALLAKLESLVELQCPGSVDIRYHSAACLLVSAMQTMTRLLQALIDNNHNWAQRIGTEDPDFFPRLARQQRPEYLWIGCSDSRVPANQVVGLDPGEVFVHRNIANVVVHSDFNCLSVIEFAVDVLKVKHIIVCGHYGCGGVKAASQDHHLGLIDNWLRHIRDVRQRHRAKLAEIDDEGRRFDRLCELNVIEQAHNTQPSSKDAGSVVSHLLFMGGSTASMTA